MPPCDLSYGGFTRATGGSVRSACGTPYTLFTVRRTNMNKRIAIAVVLGVLGIFLSCAWAAEPPFRADQFVAKFAGWTACLLLLVSVSTAAE